MRSGYDFKDGGSNARNRSTGKPGYLQALGVSGIRLTPIDSLRGYHADVLSSPAATCARLR